MRVSVVAVQRCRSPFYRGLFYGRTIDIWIFTSVFQEYKEQCRIKFPMTTVRK